ncbi:ThiF family protein [Ostertagia ostertagi]
MSTGASVEPMVSHSDNNGVQLSKAEAEVYDRQIRLWGMEAQQNAFLCGLSGVGAEIAKNLMLCGLRSLTLMDEKAVSKEDTESSFLLDDSCIGQNRARSSYEKVQALNPMVKVEVVESELNSMDADFVSRFTLVVLCDQSYDDVLLWNERCRKLNVGFIACSVFGWMGYSFFDFNDHLFLSAVEKKQNTVYDEDGGGSSSVPEAVDLDSEDVFEKKKLQYPSFEDAFNVDWSKKQLLRKSRRLIPCSYFPLKAMLRAQKEKKLTGDEDGDVTLLTKMWNEEVLAANHELERQSVQPEEFHYFFGPQLSPVCAIVGGLAGQEAIKAMSENERPLRNLFIYSALDSTGIVCYFPPQ